MTSINTQLSSLFSGSSSALAGSAGLSHTLAEALQSADGGSESDYSAGSSAYLLNLSPAAQSFLKASSASGSNSASGSTEFTLSKSQQQTIESILEKYKNAPYDQATFDSIKSDLTSAGLGTNTLALKDQVSSFDSTSEFLNALNGDTPNLNATEAGINGTVEQTKATNYLQAILTAFQSESSDYAAQKNGTSTTPASLTA